jgi:predicted phage tail protein
MHMATLILLGDAADRFTRKIELMINTPADLIKGLVANFGDAFTGYMYKSEEMGIVWRLLADTEDGVDEIGLHLRTDRCRFVLAPQVSGSGGGLGRVFLGGALLVGSFFMPASIGILGATITSTSIGLLGASMMLGGLHQMLSKPPKTSKEKEERKSQLISGNIENVQQGRCVPVLYGRKMVTDMIPISYRYTTVNLI